MIGDIIGSTIAAGVNAAVQGGPRRQFKWNKRAAEHANQMNRANQQWLLDQERQLQKEAREYDSPQAQMKRYLEAGLNPNMIYGTGSSAGQAFPIHAGNVPGVTVNAPQAGIPNIMGGFISALQAQAQYGLTQAKTDESIEKKALISAQEEVLRTNPMLNRDVLNAISNSLIATAQAKANEANEMWKIREISGEGYWRKTSAGEQKVDMMMSNLEQRFQLGQKDLAIKNKIIESKEFENAIKEVQASFMKDGDISPEHIRQFFMLLMTRLGR